MCSRERKLYHGSARNGSSLTLRARHEVLRDPRQVFHVHNAVVVYVGNRIVTGLADGFAERGHDHIDIGAIDSAIAVQVAGGGR
jgi:hypothetical protein